MNKPSRKSEKEGREFAIKKANELEAKLEQTSRENAKLVKHINSLESKIVNLDGKVRIGNSNIVKEQRKLNHSINQRNELELCLFQEKERQVCLIKLLKILPDLETYIEQSCFAMANFELLIHSPIPFS